MTEIKFSLTLGNSIIGVSILAMPYCFHQCGLILGILLLIGSMYLTRITCHLLIKIAVQTRKHGFEMLAFHTLGITGKVAVEMCIIGFLLGTCIAFFVVMGELGPAIVAKIFGIENSDRLRTVTLFLLAYLICLPLGMIKTPDGLSHLSALSIGFYFVLLLKIMNEALGHLEAFDWIEKVHYWDPSGVMKCMPIFCMAMACQTQLFEIYDSLTEPSLKKMNGIVKAAVTMCCSIYIFIGIFGYIALCDHDVPGNVLLALSPSPFTDTMKFCFVMSVAISFPLCMLPCRSSIYSCIFRRHYHSSHEITTSFIPEPYYFGITLGIVSFSLLIGLVLPSIEQVLGLVGSTIGTLISVIVPAFLFIKNTSKQTNEKLLAQVVCCIGIIMCIVSTISNLNNHPTPSSTLNKEVMRSIDVPAIINNISAKETIEGLKKKQLPMDIPDSVVNNPVRKEPPNPVEPLDQKNKNILNSNLNDPRVEKKSIDGKIGVQDNNLQKSAKLSEDNNVAVEKHKEKKDLPVPKTEAPHKAEPDIQLMNMQQQLIQKLEMQHEEQGKLIEESKKLLKHIKDSSLDVDNKEKPAEADLPQREDKASVPAPQVHIVADIPIGSISKEKPNLPPLSVMFGNITVNKYTVNIPRKVNAEVTKDKLLVEKEVYPSSTKASIVQHEPSQANKGMNFSGKNDVKLQVADVASSPSPAVSPIVNVNKKTSSSSSAKIVKEADKSNQPPHRFEKLDEEFL